MEIERISQYNGENLSKAISELFILTSFNEKQYPEYTKWFYSKMIPRLFNNTGEIYFVLDKFIIEGMIITKNTLEEKKLCQIYIANNYRRQGICSLLLEEAFKDLGTEKPLITIPEYRIEELSKIINKYGWKESGYINYNSKDIIFN